MSKITSFTELDAVIKNKRRIGFSFEGRGVTYLVEIERLDKELWVLGLGKEKTYKENHISKLYSTKKALVWALKVFMKNWGFKEKEIERIEL